MQRNFRIVCSLAAAALMAATSVRAQEATEKKSHEPGPWKLSVSSNLNLAESAFSDNWSGGDKGSVTWVLGSNLGAERQFTKKYNWSNALQLAYGQTLRQVEETAGSGKRKWDSPEKTTDLIQFESVGRFTLDKFADPYVAFRLDSQFADESNPIGRIGFNPIRLKETAGIARVLEKTDSREAITRLGFGFRQNISRFFTDDTGMTKESVTTNDGGFEWQTDVKRPILDNRVTYTGKLLAFMPVFLSSSGDLEDFDKIAQAAAPGREAVADFWKSPDVNFQNTFTSQITKLVSVNLYLQWVYNKFDEATNVDTALPAEILIEQVDRGIRKGGQFKQTLAIGLTYNFL
ncbi:MAG: DUF3078 domain-containing protein [bacterium]